MAVEAPHITLFPPPNRQMIDQGNGNRYDDPLQSPYGMALLPMYASGITDSFPTPDSGLTCSLPLSRKRSRHSSSLNPPFSLPNPWLGTFAQDISSQIYQQQWEMDRFIAYHTQEVRREMEEMRRSNWMRLMVAAEEGIMKRLKAKEEEIVKMGQLNWWLEEKVKSLSLENQMWRELAETNEATANALRNNLQQVVAQVEQQDADNAGKATTDDTQSYCGSNYDGGGERKVNNEDEYCCTSSRWCRNCGKEESCVLVLPCRHLCVCSLCGSSIRICPVCKSTKSAGVDVNMS